MAKFQTLLLALATSASVAPASVIHTRDDRPDLNKPFQLTVWAEDGDKLKFTQEKDGVRSTTTIDDFKNEKTKFEDRVVGKIDFQSAFDDPKHVWIDNEEDNLHVKCDITIDAEAESTDDFLDWNLYSVKRYPGDMSTDMHLGAWKATCKWTQY